MALNFMEQNVTKYFNISNQQYSKSAKATEIQTLNSENIYIWKLLEEISNSNLKNNDVLWLNREEEFLIRQWIEYTNTNILLASAIHVTNKVLSELNHVLAQQSFLVANRLTLADIFMYYSLISIFKDLTFLSKEKFQHVSRWFNYVQSLPQVRLGNPIVLFSRTPLY